MSPLKNKISLLLCLLLFGHTTLSLAESADRNKPLLMEADRVTVDDANQTSTFEGNVEMRQGTLLIEAGRIVVKQDQKGYSQITATGQLAHFRQKREGANEFAEGYGERIEYDSFAETANIYGQARVKREGDDVQGEHIIYNTKSGVFQVFGSSGTDLEAPEKGRVTIIIQPKSKAGDAASSAPAAATPTPTMPLQP
ncbi:MAG: lipopolysaccharide transport periplasmic protein LptA [Gallionellales bacterium 35-53-114]|jgi:lipopolysaccharide export system protein LptA|nr:MAG: lipopolysaccharide transport periplasmic protein LptA [Gallionellales bacterium 35-53-114]OYZ63776.1 MAG: lipopolysaccharide transport periplasmic protein LptA [Gallionellales bacterium 24-53-125]OZB09392.1 MAG: lipopolysaccharide transport periplasmic protein LptA [Gallionellales bacterium 39-52-133]HQS57952.1 lipopolysaccharide transport periplasmic protein LptA [Gallionellaceae bacterium]HQS76113.1 lipopolysaccharide transport periplasmic protein LptA [Gallionellaceae bacterium]